MMKKIFMIDWTLIVVFVLSAFSGIGLHAAGHGNDHELWHDWAVLHVSASLLFFITAVFHAMTHGAWYRGFVRNGIGKKSKNTAVLSAVFLFLSVTGFVLLDVSGPNSEVGLWHYGTGLIAVILSAGHILKRIPALRKSLKR